MQIVVVYSSRVYRVFIAYKPTVFYLTRGK